MLASSMEVQGSNSSGRSPPTSRFPKSEPLDLVLPPHQHPCSFITSDQIFRRNSPLRDLSALPPPFAFGPQHPLSPHHPQILQPILPSLSSLLPSTCVNPPTTTLTTTTTTTTAFSCLNAGGGIRDDPVEEEEEDQVALLRRLKYNSDNDINVQQAQSSSPPTTPVSLPPRNGKGRKRNNKSGWTRMTPTQLTVLEAEFQRVPIPDRETRKRIAAALGVTDRKVQVPSPKIPPTLPSQKDAAAHLSPILIFFWDFCRDFRCGSRIVDPRSGNKRDLDRNKLHRPSNCIIFFFVLLLV